MTPSGERSEEMPSLDFESIELGAKDSEVGNRFLSAMNCNYEPEVTVGVARQRRPKRKAEYSGRGMELSS